MILLSITFTLGDVIMGNTTFLCLLLLGIYSLRLFLHRRIIFFSKVNPNTPASFVYRNYDDV